MENQEIKINETHMCVLKRNNNRLYVDYKKLVFEFSAELEKLEQLYRNPNRTSYELENYIANSPLKLLLADFNFCSQLSRPFQGLYHYRVKSYSEYKELLDRFNAKKKLDNDGLNIEVEIKKFQQSNKDIIMDKIRERVLAYLLNKEYIQLNKNEDVLAYSHRKTGWSFPNFELGKDFNVRFKTNYGYGKSSYFFTNITYKEIDILPYSDWITYRFAKKSEIIGYTRRHQLKNEAWRATMEFTSELYNDSIEHPKDFVEKWIINECVEMVEGLESLLNRDKNHEVIHSFFHPGMKSILNGIDLLYFKGEKISGALDFLNKIKTLAPYSSEIPNIIDRIFSCNLSIYWDLQEEAESLTKEIVKLNTEISEIEPKWSPLKKELDKFHNIKANLVTKFLKDNPGVEMTADISNNISDTFEGDNPRYKIALTEFGPIDEKYRSLKSKKRTANDWRIKFEDFVTAIEKGFSSNNRNINLRRSA